MTRRNISIVIGFALLANAFCCAKEKPSSAGRSSEEFANLDNYSTSAEIKQSSEDNTTLATKSGTVVVPARAFANDVTVKFARIYDPRKQFGFGIDRIILGDSVRLTTVTSDDEAVPLTLAPIEVNIVVLGKISAADVTIILKDIDDNLLAIPDGSYTVTISGDTSTVTFATIRSTFEVIILTRASAEGLTDITELDAVPDPGDFEIRLTEANSILVGWVPDDRATSETTYVVAALEGGTAPNTCGSGSVRTAAEVGTGSAVHFGNLDPATDYSFRVCAQTEDGISSGTILSGTTASGSDGPTAAEDRRFSQTRSCSDAQSAGLQTPIFTVSGTIFAWSAYSSARLGSNDDAAAKSVSTEAGVTKHLKLTDLNFRIPDDADIDGVRLFVSRSGTTSLVRDKSVRLVLGGTIATSGDLAETSSSWPATTTDTSYGGPTNVWSQTLDESEIESSGFGIAFAAEFSATGATALIDSCAITVFYH